MVMRQGKPKIKVCGLTQASQSEALEDLRIDYLGFIFYRQSPRYVLKHLTPEQIARFSQSRKVGVFVNEAIKTITEMTKTAGLNAIQLHGDEPPEDLLRLRNALKDDVEIIKVVRVGNQNPDALQSVLDKQTDYASYFLFDTDSTAFGGTGRSFDWDILNRLTIKKPYFLSGGISAENLSGIQNLKDQPYALDINSKFETAPGLKDLGRIKLFLSLFQ